MMKEEMQKKSGRGMDEELNINVGKGGSRRKVAGLTILYCHQPSAVKCNTLSLK